MKLTMEGIKEAQAWKEAGVVLPAYDVEAVTAKTKASPRWVHFGIGNIFRIFMGTIADDLIASGDLDRGITCLETFDFDVVDQIYAPYDNLTLCVTMHNDGRRDRRVIGSLSEAVAAKPGDTDARQRIIQIFENPELQLISCTITEKGYELKKTDGTYLPWVEADIENGPEGDLNSAMSLITAMMIRRFRAGGQPLALVSMDNVSQNGAKFRESVLDIAHKWADRGFADEAFLQWLEDETRVTFPWSMIDKITPRPDEEVAAELTAMGIEDMNVVVTGKRTYIAPFVNAERPQYLVVEDSFPNGRPPFEKAGVYMTDRETVNASERMKVTVCLNPIHSALGTYGCVLGYTKFSVAMEDPDFLALANLVGPVEGMDVVIDPKIISPQAFLDEVLHERFPNPYMPDTVQRLVTDISQGLSVRFGVTTAAHVEKYGTAEKLIGIPLAIAGWLRYLLAVQDDGKTTYVLSPDPLNDEMTGLLAGIEVGKPETLTDQLRPILSNQNLFGINLYEAGIGEKIEDLFRQEIAGPGAVRETLHKYTSES